MWLLPYYLVNCSIKYCTLEICFCILVLTLLNFFNQMDKVHSTIKSLECVDILQVNVKEDTDIVHSGHGSGTVRLLVM